MRWTQWHTPLPLFGVEVGAAVSIAVNMVLGAVSCLVAFSLLRLTSRAWRLGVAYLAVSLVLTLANWDRWDAWVAAEVHNRRAYQGVPVREGEVEFMQRLFPEALLAGLALYGVGLTAVKKRLDE